MNQESYYNSFYNEISVLDAKSNGFSKIKNLLPLNIYTKKIRFLDIGCGHGSVTEKLIELGHTGYGMELSTYALETLKAKGFNTIKHDIQTPFALNDEFEIVFILDVLEHVFDPLGLLQEAIKLTSKDGIIIVSVPLYFDLLDRLKILFTGSIISLDNLCYGEEIYRKFRSYNYDHIRFFRPKDIFEMGERLQLEVERVEYSPTVYGGRNIILKNLIRIISNKYTVNLFPGLLAHSLKIKWIVKR